MIVVTTEAIAGQRIVEHMGIFGAAAIVAVDLDDHAIGDSMLMVCATGTAVRLG